MRKGDGLDMVFYTSFLLCENCHEALFASQYPCKLIVMKRKYSTGTNDRPPNPAAYLIE